MKFFALLLSLLAALPALADNPHVLLNTSLGKVEIELYPDKAPITVANFLNYVKAGHYDGTIFHRVIKDFVAQGGNLTVSLDSKPTNAPIKNEADNGLKNVRGALAMARTDQVDSATDQFFIDIKDQPSLNHTDNTPAGWGYAVFGQVVSGMNVVDSMAAMPVYYWPPYFDALPQTPIVIQSATVLAAPAPFSAKVAASGTTASLSLNLSVTPADADVGKAVYIFVAAILPHGEIYLNTPAGWVPYDSAAPGAFWSGNLQAQTAPLLNGLDVRGLAGTVIYVGYGLGTTSSASLAELLQSQRLAPVYTL